MNGLRCSPPRRLLSASCYLVLAVAAGSSVTATGAVGVIGAGSAAGVASPTAAAVAAVALPQGPRPVFDLMWGEYCNTSISGVDACDGDFQGPRGVAVNAMGQVYVADSYNDRIQRFDSDGNFQIRWGATGSGDGQFDKPEGIAIDSAGNVYVVDFGNNRIQKFDPDGNFIGKLGSAGTGDYQFQSPMDVAVDLAGNMYVSDWSNCRVMKYNFLGQYLGEWGEFCDTSVSGVDGCDGDFRGPYGIAVDSSYNVYVTDSLNDRIQKFDSTGTNLLAKWGEHCEVDTSGVDGCDADFYYPWGVAIDADENVYVSDNSNYRIQKFDSDGNFLAKWGTYGSGPEEFRDPHGLGFGPSGYLFIADGALHVVKRFAPPPLNFFIGAPEALASVRR